MSRVLGFGNRVQRGCCGLSLEKWVWLMFGEGLMFMEIFEEVSGWIGVSAAAQACWCRRRAKAARDVAGREQHAVADSVLRRTTHGELVGDLRRCGQDGAGATRAVRWRLQAAMKTQPGDGGG
ncbi:hypothetical protein Droror1_Dr00021243 [Drosera rotundifolia]